MIRLLAVLCLVMGLSALASAQGLTVSAGATALTIHPGDSNVALPVALGSSTYAGAVTVTLTGLPSGIVVQPLTLSAGGSGTLLLSATVSADQEDFPATDPSNPDSATHAVQVLAFSGTLQATADLSLTVSLENIGFVPQTIDRPILRIDTNGVPIADKTTNVAGTITITSADGSTSILPGAAGTDNTATFHLHGNSTVEMPKKPYHLKLHTSSDLLTAMGIVCPYVKGSKPVCDKSKSYILLANYDDKTLLRDWSASALANAIPIGGAYLNSPADSPTPSGTSTLMPWAPHSIFVELFLNGVYEGDYEVIEEVKADSHRVDIDEMSETDTSGNELTGGYLMEIDGRQDEDFVFVTPQGLYVGLDDPDFTPEVPEQTAYIQSYVDTAEAALFASNYTDPTLGWRAYFDEASAINYYIVNDLMGNWDAGRLYSSVYLYKNEDNPLLYMGPVWDFDVSTGNAFGYPIVNATIPWMQVENPWYPQWFSDPGFKADVVTQWNALKAGGVFSAWLAAIAQQAVTLQQTVVNDNGRWPKLGIRVWPNAEAEGSYSSELGYLVDWINLRYAYLDALFNAKAPETTTLTVPGGTLRAGTSASFTAQVKGGSSPTGYVTLTCNGVVVGIAPLNSGAATFTVSDLLAGTDSLEAIYNGDDRNALSASSPVSVTVLAPLDETNTNLSISTSQVDYGTAVVLTGVVVPNSGTATLTGSMSFAANDTTLGTATVSSSGVATFSVPVLPAPSDVVTANYLGSNTYAASASNPETITVISPPATFTLQASPTSSEATSGRSASFELTVTPVYYFSAAVSFSCSGLPVGASCSFSPASVTPSGGPVATTLLVSIAATTAAGTHDSMPWEGLGLGGAGVLLFGCAGRLRRRRLRALLLVPVLLGIGLSLAGCGSSTSVAATPFQVTAVSGSLSQTTTLRLLIAN